MNRDDKFMTGVAVSLGLTIAIVLGVIIRAIRNDKAQRSEFTRSVTWHSASGEVRTYERTTTPYVHVGWTDFLLPDGTKIEVRDGVLEIKTIAEKP